MASISKESNGRRTIQFFAPCGKRKSLRLGKVSQEHARAVGGHVQELANAARLKAPCKQHTAAWLADLDDSLYGRLVKLGLVQARAQAAPEVLRPTLGGFITAYLAGRKDLKSGTLTHYGHTKRNLIDHFGESRALDSITPGHADEFKIYLIGLELSEATVQRRCKLAKQYFRAACRKKLIADNPFEDFKSGDQSNKAREFFVTRAMTQAVIDECPDAEWKLLVALSRFAGLRCPSEHLRLRWTDVDWERGRFTVHSPKTEHHKDKDSRLVPIFPELLPYLRDVFEQAEDGAEFVITRYRAGTMNLRTQFTRIIKRAKLEPWPRLWQNLRSTCETELMETWPAHIVCAWIGNSEAVARKHYLQVTDEHFERAA